MPASRFPLLSATSRRGERPLALTRGAARAGIRNAAASRRLSREIRWSRCLADCTRPVSPEPRAFSAERLRKRSRARAPTSALARKRNCRGFGGARCAHAYGENKKGPRAVLLSAPSDSCNGQKAWLDQLVGSSGSYLRTGSATARAEPASDVVESRLRRTRYPEPRGSRSALLPPAR